MNSISFDFVVVGGGLAGITAARKGLHTALVQDRPVLGGNSSSEIRVVPVGASTNHGWARETGIIEEIFDYERALNFEEQENSQTTSWVDHFLYDACVECNNLELFLNTSIRMVEKDDTGNLISVHGCQLGTEREIDFRANLFADCTGDGSIAAFSGCDFDIAPELMASSLLFRSIDTGEDRVNSRLLNALRTMK